jgi:hypothetical protein
MTVNLDLSKPSICGLKSFHIDPIMSNRHNYHQYGH